METKAKAKFLKISPRKVRLVADLIRGLNVEEAMVQLQFTRKGSCEPLRKLLKSAMANAEENNDLKRSNLFISEIRVDEAPITYRWMPRAMGRATPIRKRASHVSVTLGERIPTTDKKVKEKKDKKDDIIKIEDFDQLKAVEKEKGKEEKMTDGKGKGGAAAKPQKGFSNKIFNRRSGER
jgi:large subunit ribosomal protein L22